MRSTLIAVLMLALAAPVALAHPERQAHFPDGSVGAVPKYRKTADQILTVCKRDSAKRIRRSFSKQPKVAQDAAAAARALRLPPHPGRRERRPQRGDHPHHAGRLPGGAEPARSRARPALRERLRGDRQLAARLRRGRRGRRRQGRQLRVPAQVPERPEPDRDHRRRARRGPRLRHQVQPPDPGHGPHAQGRPDLRPADQAQRHPRRPRRRHLPEELHRRVLGLQQHLHPRDQRLPDGGHPVALLARVRLPLLHLRPRPLQPARGVRLRRLRHLPRLGPRGPLPALRDRDPQLELAPQHDRLLGHGRQRRVGARQPLPPQLDRHDDRLVRLRPPRHAAGLRQVGAQPHLLQQRGLLQRRARRLLQEHAARPA